MLLLLLVWQTFALSCWNLGEYDVQTATTVTAATSGVNCPVGVCLVITAKNGHQSATCGDCDAAQVASFERGGTSYARAYCCDTDDCNDPTIVGPGPVPCSDHPTRALCLQDLSCGWCQTNTSTSQCIQSGTDAVTTAPQACTDLNGTWDFPYYNTDWQSTQQLVTRPGISISTDLPSANTAITGIDILVLFQGTASMQPLVTTFLNSLDAISDVVVEGSAFTPRWGFASFRGYPGGPNGAYQTDYMFEIESPMASSTDAATTILNSYTFPPNSLAPKYPCFSALLQAAFPTVTAWDPGHAKLVFLLTDQTSLDSDDNQAFGFLNHPNNNDDILDGFPPGTGEGFPSPPLLLNKYVQYGVWPIFGTGVDVGGFWGFVAALSELGTSVDLSAYYAGGDQPALPNTVGVAILDAISANRSPWFFGDQVYLDSAANLAGSAQGGAIFIQPGTPTTSTFTAGSHTYPSSSSYSFTLSQDTREYDCLGVLGGTAVVDPCGVCDGGCVFCNGIDARFDACGVCGGQNLTCYGCDEVLNSGLTYDACGVCGGDNSTCIGCDGVVNSGKEEYCGYCGIGDVCNTFHPLGIAGIVLIICGFLFLILFALFCLIVKKALDHKRNRLKKDQLFVEAEQRHKTHKGGMSGGSVS